MNFASPIYPTLIDCGSSLNLLNNSMITEHSLGDKVTACQTTKVTLADGTFSILLSRQITLEFTIAGVRYHKTFLIAPIRTQPVILGMPFLERVHPDVNW